jgi:hypothetical protein
MFGDKKIRWNYYHFFPPKECNPSFAIFEQILLRTINPISFQ